jgi:hypothetical protein
VSRLRAYNCFVKVKTQVNTQVTTRLEQEARDRRDIEIIERNADRLNREALDTLDYQQLW